MTNFINKHLVSHLANIHVPIAATLALCSLVFSANVVAATPPVLADKPLAATTGQVKPNLMFVFDTSASMNKTLANDTLDDAAQCKAATKNRNGTAISGITIGSPVATRMTIAVTGFNVNDKVYLAIPNKPQYSGLYQIKVRNGISTSCISGTEVYTTTVQVRPPYIRGETSPNIRVPDKFNQTSYNAGNPLADPPVPPTNGCSVTTPPPADSGATTGANLNLGGGFVVGASGVTTTPSSACYWRDRPNTNGCKVTTSAPANSGSTSVTYNRGGGFVVDASGITATPSASCYWEDPADIPVGTFVSCNYQTTGANTVEVDIASGAPAGALTPAEIQDAYIVLQQDSSSCVNNEPPLMAAKIQSLFYDPSVEYVPPPKPKAIGLGTASPANRLPSMTSAYTSNWTNVRVDGTRLDASGDPVTNANGTTCNADGSNLASCNNTRKAPDGTFDFKKWEELVYCDTPNRPAAFSSDKSWHESSHCKRNTPASTSSMVNASPRYPYPYPAQTDGGVTSPSKTNFYVSNILHQNGVAKLTTDNPVADLYAFGETYQFAAPFYYTVDAIEYCKSAKLNDCVMANAPSGAYTVPAYVRYCKASAQATDTSTSPDKSACQGTYTGSAGGDYRYARYGLFKRVDVVPANSYYRYPGRDDCSGSIGSNTGCSYDEEMTNMANWYAYYRNRMQLMKSAIGRSFSELDKPETSLIDESLGYRIGFITVENYTGTGNYLPIADFLNGPNNQKEKFFTSIYSRRPAGGTSLRDVLGTVGRIYAGKATDVGLPAGDPVQQSCQQNFTLLTTDGYWNGAPGKTVTGGTIGDQDGLTGVAKPQKDALAIPDTLADVAQYYYTTDIRDASFGNCVGSVSSNVCLNDVKASGDDTNTKQHMTTYTLGLGVDGLLSSTGYKLSPSESDDYNELLAGTKNWPQPDADNGDASYTALERATVDDLWHAAVNGRGEYFSAKNSTTLRDSIKTLFNAIDSTKGTRSAIAVSNRVVEGGGDAEYAYVAKFSTDGWTGNLIARELVVDPGPPKSVSASQNVAWCVESEAAVPGVNGACTPNTTSGLATKVAANTDTRTIYTNAGGSLTAFEYSNLTSVQKAYFQPGYLNTRLSQWAAYSSAQIANVTGDNIVKYLRGQDGFEELDPDINNQLFRARTAVLGDIVDSDPEFVGKPKFAYLDAGYADFVTNKATRAKTVFVGANDGMLHAFNADTGEERWAFVPSTVMPNMWKLADKNYRDHHANFVNGKMTVADIQVGSTWKTILISGLGQGGRGYFALDITDPASPSLLWEINANTSGFHNLGYSYGKPKITKRPDNTWVVLLPSGYNNIPEGGNYSSSDGEGRLFVLNANTGADLSSGGISTGVGSTSDPSGLAQVSYYALNPFKNNKSTYVYGGDLRGNLWRFDLSTNSVTLFTTLVNGSGQAQPITVAPTLSTLEGKRIVLVGTGKYLEADDLLPPSYQTQSLYAIKDTSSTITGLRSTLVQQTLTPSGPDQRNGSHNPVDWATKNGWYIDLPGSGERQVLDSKLALGILTVGTLVPPTGSCDSNGSSWKNVLNYATGGPPDVVDGSGNVVPGTVVSERSNMPIVGLTEVDFGTESGNGVITTESDSAIIEAGEAGSGELAKFAGSRAIWRELIQE